MPPEEEKDRFYKALISVFADHPNYALSIAGAAISGAVFLAWTWSSSIGNELASLRSQVSVLAITNRGLQGERGPAGERGPTGATGPQGERGPPGAQGDTESLNAKIAQLSREVGQLRQALDEARAAAGSRSLQVPTLGPASPTPVASNGANTASLSDCRTVPEAGPVRVRSGEVLCSTERVARATIDQVSSNRIRYIVNGQSVTCASGDLCSFNWPGTQPRFRVISASGNGVAELFFE